MKEIKDFSKASGPSDSKKEELLLEALGDIPEELLEEAMTPPKKKGILLPRAAAAAIVCAIGLGTVLTGGLLISQQKKLEALQKEIASESSLSGNGIGIPGVMVSDSRFASGLSYSDLFESLKDRQESYSKGWGIDMMDETVQETAAASDTATSDAPNHSSTNVMTQGVDESDLVKTDGSFIYMVQSGSVKITDIRGGIPGETIQVMPSYEAPSDQIEEIYVADGSLVILTDHYERAAKKSGREYNNQTIVYVYDISDPLHPLLRGSMKQDGILKTSRKVGDILYLFTNDYLALPDMSAKNASKESNLSLWVPTVNDAPIDSGCFYLPEEGSYATIISSFDLKAPGECIDAKVIVDNSGELYMGTSHFYLYGYQWNASRSLTALSSFSYEEGRILQEADTTVNGTIRDAFAIHESEGFLTILTTDNNNGSSVNTLFVLDQDLRLTGRMDEIARGEQIYAARYVGDYVYFVTYRNTDPMFVADLSDPTSPKLLGEVKLSGFSEYLHLWDDTHVLGMGYETNDAGEFQGMKLVMFDVSDPTRPLVENSTIIGALSQKNSWAAWYYSYSLENYRAILVDPEKNLMGIAGVGEAWDGDTLISHCAYYLLSYEENGFRLNLEAETSQEQLYSLRGLYSGNWFYLTSNGTLRSFDMNDGFKEH